MSGGPSSVVRSAASMRQPSLKVDSMSCRVMARALVAGLPVAEAEDEVAAAGGQDGPYGREVGGAVRVFEDVEQSAVEDGVERLAELVELPRVPTQEPRGQPTGARLRFGGAQGGGGEVDTGGVQAERGGHEDVLSGSAADVEHPALNGTLVGEGAESRLGPAEIQCGVSV